MSALLEDSVDAPGAKASARGIEQSRRRPSGYGRMPMRFAKARLRESLRKFLSRGFTMRL